MDFFLFSIFNFFFFFLFLILAFSLMVEKVLGCLSVDSRLAWPVLRAGTLVPAPAPVPATSEERRELKLDTVLCCLVGTRMLSRLDTAETGSVDIY